ncbi:hypothetical protein KY290_027336 [Solanum tuberosum]|uniref:Uncharacterized protein n=1 Tax=Solanum tuberosum TaxID=4113 RepID=A0ABQ7UGF0_SOLTU|nr:hypothetical protein KY290_027336 [Solanum tuberosum]
MATSMISETWCLQTKRSMPWISSIYISLLATMRQKIKPPQKSMMLAQMKS